MDASKFQSFIQTAYEINPPASHFTICCISAFIGETVTYPLDSVKTRLQVANVLSTSEARPRLIPLVVSIVKNEGIFTFWQGLSPALYRHFVYTGARMPIYEFIRNYVFEIPPASEKARRSRSGQKTAESVEAKDVDVSPNLLLRAAVGGIISGAVAQLIASPTDLLKVRLQTERRISMVATTRVCSDSGKAAAPASPKAPKANISVTMRHLIKEGGFFGLWRGGLPNCQRAALVNMGEMTTYDTAKRFLQHRFGFTDGPLLHGLSSTMSGFVSAILGTPADLIKTRIMNQRLITASGTNLPPLYTGMIDCAVKVVKNEGFFTLYRGFFLIWARMAPWSLTFWLTYEKMRIYAGAGGF